MLVCQRVPYFRPSHHQELGEMGDLYTPWKHFFPWKTRGFPTGNWEQQEWAVTKMGCLPPICCLIYWEYNLHKCVFSSMSVMKRVIKMQVSNRKQKKWWIKVQQTRGQWLDRMGYMGILTNAWKLQAIRTWICLSCYDFLGMFSSSHPKEGL